MNKLIKAKEELTLALEKLEETIFDKLNQTKQKAAVDHDESEEVQNCYNEITELQKELSRLGMENEDLRIENKDLQKDKSKAKEIAKEITLQIKSDLSQIKSIINKK